MRTDFTHCEPGRITQGYMASPVGSTFGAFTISDNKGRKVLVVVDDGKESGWEHVSVSVRKKRHGKIEDVMPDWELMCNIKDIFWGPEESVQQLHPKQSEYVNYHPMALHLWKKVGTEVELPPSDLVGPKTVTQSELLTMAGAAPLIF